MNDASGIFDTKMTCKHNVYRPSQYFSTWEIVTHYTTIKTSTSDLAKPHPLARIKHQKRKHTKNLIHTRDLDRPGARSDGRSPPRSSSYPRPLRPTSLLQYVLLCSRPAHTTSVARSLSAARPARARPATNNDVPLLLRGHGARHVPPFVLPGGAQQEVAPPRGPRVGVEPEAPGRAAAPCRRRRRRPRGRRGGGGAGQGRRGDGAHRAQDGQLQALRRGHPALHGLGVRPAAGPRRPQGHQDEDDLAFQRRRRHRTHAGTARVYWDGEARGARRLPPEPGPEGRSRGPQWPLPKVRGAQGAQRHVHGALQPLRQLQRQGGRREAFVRGGRDRGRGRRQLPRGQGHGRRRLRVRHRLPGARQDPRRQDALLRGARRDVRRRRRLPRLLRLGVPQVRPRGRRHRHRHPQGRHQEVPGCHPPPRQGQDRGRQDHPRRGPPHPRAPTPQKGVWAGDAGGRRGGVRDQVLRRGDLLRGEERADVRGGDRGRVGERDAAGGRGRPAQVPGGVRPALLAHLQGAGHPAEGVLPLQRGAGGVRGDVRRRLRAADDLRQLPLQARRAGQPHRGHQARRQHHRQPRPRHRAAPGDEEPHLVIDHREMIFAGT